MIDSDEDDGMTIEERIDELIKLRNPVRFDLPNNKKIKLNKTVLLNNSDSIAVFERMNGIIFPNKLSMMDKPLSFYKNMSLQRPANPKSLYFLEKTEKFFLKNYITHESILADGRYIFVISTNDPLTIRCARTVLDSNYHWHDAVDGHTSIGYRRSVYFAGNLLFRQGELELWSNASGHYKPPKGAELLLAPYIRHLLPDSKFMSIEFNK